MTRSPHTTGFFLLVLLAAVGYGLLTLPPQIIEQYNAAAKLSPWVASAYLAAVSLGGLIVLGLIVWFAHRTWQNTRDKTKQRARREQNPSEMSQSARAAEVADNLAAGKEFASSEGLNAQLRSEIERAAEELERKRETRRLEIVAFGTISSGKSSLLNALAGRDVFRTNVVGGTTAARSEIPWPEGDSVVLVDTPGLAEVRGEARAAEAANAARDADMVLLVVDGPLKAYERDLLGALSAMEKRVLVCLNKVDWYDAPQQQQLIEQIAEQVGSAVAKPDIVAVRSRPVSRRRVRVLADGSQEEQTTLEPPDIAPLADRMLSIVRRDGSQLLLANLLLQSRGLVDEAKERVLAALDARADEVITRYMWAAGSATAVNPVPLLDIAGGSAIIVKMVLDLAAVYKQSIDVDTVVTLLGEMGKNLVTMLGASAAAPALGTAIASLLKTVPGIGTIAGGLLQGLVQALVARWIGRVFAAYFRNDMQPPAGGLAELARREWSQVTRPDQLRHLVVLGHQRLKENNHP